MDGKVFARIIAALVLVAAVAAIGFFAFQAGVAQGSPATIQAPSDELPPMPSPYYGYGFPFHRPFGFGFGFLGLLLPLFFLFIAWRALHFMFWGPRRWHHMHGQGSWEAGVPPMFEEWHKRAHAGTSDKE